MENLLQTITIPSGVLSDAQQKKYVNAMKNRIALRLRLNPTQYTSGAHYKKGFVLTVTNDDMKKIEKNFATRQKKGKPKKPTAAVITVHPPTQSGSGLYAPYEQSGNGLLPHGQVAGQFGWGQDGAGLFEDIGKVAGGKAGGILEKQLGLGEKKGEKKKAPSEKKKVKKVVE